MKSLIARIVVAAAVTLPMGPTASAAGEHVHGKPQHGGVVVETRSMDMELVARPERIELHVSEHGKPLVLTGASARLTLLTGAEKADVPLAQVGDRFEAVGAFKVAKGTKAVAVVTLAGKAPVTGRFEVK